MYPLVEFPELVQHYAPFFEEVFSPEAFIWTSNFQMVCKARLIYPNLQV